MEELEFIKQYKETKENITAHYRLKEFFINFRFRLSQSKNLNKLIKELNTLKPEDFEIKKRRKEKGYSVERFFIYSKKNYLGTLFIQTDRNILILPNETNFTDKGITDFLNDNFFLDLQTKKMETLKNNPDFKYLFENGTLY